MVSISIERERGLLCTVVVNSIQISYLFPYLYNSRVDRELTHSIKITKKKIDTMKSASLVAIALSSIPASHAFQASRTGHYSAAARIPKGVRSNSSSPSSLFFSSENDTSDAFSQKIHSSITAAAAAAALFISTTIPADAVSGGGLDYAGLDISNQDYSNGNYKGKDFTQVLAKATTFANSNLQGCRFYKAYLVSIWWIFINERDGCILLVIVYIPLINNCNVQYSSVYR